MDLPLFFVSRDNCIQLDHEAFITEAMQQEDVEQVLNDLQNDIGLSDNDQNSDGASVSTQSLQLYPRLTFLGTGSSIPSKGRNVSGLVVHLRYAGTILKGGFFCLFPLFFLLLFFLFVEPNSKVLARQFYSRCMMLQT